MSSSLSNSTMGGASPAIGEQHPAANHTGRAPVRLRLRLTMDPNREVFWLGLSESLEREMSNAVTVTESRYDVHTVAHVATCHVADTSKGACPARHLQGPFFEHVSRPSFYCLFAPILWIDSLISHIAL